MVELAVNTNNQISNTFTPYLVKSEANSINFNQTTCVLILASILVLLQVLDGVLTASGVSIYGTAAEGNPLLKNLMNYVGFIPALCIAKTFAIGIIFGMVSVAKESAWILVSFTGLIGFYTFAAVIPWIKILNGMIF